jgi:hypothetical protein
MLAVTVVDSAASRIRVAAVTSGYTGTMRACVTTRARILATAGLVVCALAAVVWVSAARPPTPPGDGESAVARGPGHLVSTAGSNAGAPAAATPQFRRRRRTPPRYPDPNAPNDGSFSFARVMYTSVRYEALGQGWHTDYPEGDKNYMSRLQEFTLTRVRGLPGGYPDHVVLTLYDEELFRYPFIFMSDVGTVGFDEVEVERLRAYLLKGGFLWVDDFWGNAAWDQWTREIGRVLPPGEYPIVDIPPDHPIRQMLYPVDKFPQIPSIQWWRSTGRYSTSERGAESAVPHMRGISDHNGRLMVLMSHNTDIADGWERENEDFEFFENFSFPSYAVGINVGLYSMTR